MNLLFEPIGNDYMYEGGVNSHLVHEGQSILEASSGIKYGFYYHEISGSRHYTKCLRHTYEKDVWKISFTIQAEKMFFIGIEVKEKFKDCKKCIDTMLWIEKVLLEAGTIDKIVKGGFMPGKEMPIEFLRGEKL